MSLVVKEFLIEGYRPFEKLHLPRLGRANLLTGRNNVGKSSVLEALYLFTQRFSPSSIMTVLRDRDEVARRSTTAFRGANASLLVDGLGSLFCGRAPFPHDRSLALWSPSTPEQRLTMGLVWSSDARSEPSSGVLPGFETEERESRLIRPEVRVQFGQERVVRYELDAFNRYPGLLPFEASHCVYLNAATRSAAWATRMWERIALTPLQDEVLNALRLIEPGLQGISPVSGDDGLRPTGFKVKLLGNPDPFPLRALGEGIHHILEIGLGLVTARNGILLLDEIENGIHYTVQPELWSFIFRVAAALNVQVFATTHSYDCILAFQEAAGQTPEEGVVVRLERKSHQVRVTSYDEDRLQVVAREEIEVR